MWMSRSSRLDGGHEFPAATHAVTRTENSSWAGSLQVSLATRTDAHRAFYCHDLSPWLGA